MIIKTFILALTALVAGEEIPLPAGSGAQQLIGATAENEVKSSAEIQLPAGSGARQHTGTTAENEVKWSADIPLPAAPEAYQHTALPENNFHYEAIAIHTDRDIYIAGERLYFRLDISGNGAGPSSSLAYVALRDRENKTIVTLCTEVNGHSGHGSIYIPDTLASAPYQLVAFTNLMRNRADSYYGTKQLLIANRFDDGPVAGEELLKIAGSTDAETSGRHKGNAVAGDRAHWHAESIDGGAPVIKINLPSREFSTRERIKFTVESRMPGDSILSFSVSVVQKESLFSSFREELFFRKPSSSLPQGAGSFFMETHGQVISGKVTCSVSGEPVEGATVLLNTPDSTLNLLYARSLPKGDFHFLLDHYHQGRDLYLSLYDSKETPEGRIRMDDKFYFKTPFEPAPMVVAEGFERFLVTSRDIVTVNRVFGMDHNRDEDAVKEVYPPKIYSMPTVYFNLFDEYVHFSDIHEIARELIPVLRIRRQRDERYRSTLLLYHDEHIMIETPAYFLDGLFVDDVNRILHLDSRILSKMEILNHMWQHGSIRFPGIVAFFSNNNEFRNIRPASTTISFHQPATAPKASYNPPTYNGDGPGNLTVPDFRQLLFWEPDLTENNAEIEFYPGDIKGEFVILVRGVTSGGTIIIERAEITIR
jgi:hypothetical protein